MNTYEAIVSREGKWWMVSIPAIDGLTQARTLAEAPAMAAEYIAASTKQDLNDVAVEWIVEDIAGIRIPDSLNEIAAARSRAAELERFATARAAALARELRDVGGLTVRDIGSILGVSYQRAQQLATTAQNIVDGIDNGGIGEIVGYLEIEPIDKRLTSEVIESFHEHAHRA